MSRRVAAGLSPERGAGAMTGPVECAEVPTPIGPFRVVYEGNQVRTVDLLERGLPTGPAPEGVRVRHPPFPGGSPPRQIQEYFTGRRRTFDLEPAPGGAGPFDRAVWKALCGVPPGATVTYGELARRVGHPGAARAVGGSMRRNPIPIVIPCHRVVGEDGSLTGFGLGLWRKRWLLDREGAWPIRSKSAEGPRDHQQRTLDATRVSERPRRAEARAPA
jgi:methylated-DNA-[protein]-cysteine S-methyltransferase